MQGFSYAYLLLDVLGVLICALGLKFSILHAMILVKWGPSARYVLCLGGNLALVVSGAVMVCLPFAWTNLLLALGMIAMAFGCGRLAYTR